MEKKEIAFIICSNNEQYYQECVKYIEDLVVPDGYSTDIVCVKEANSMAEGYNAAMQSSDAKYKVYLHQDTFILNSHFIEDIIHIFESDNLIGMIGAIGCKKLPEDANAYLKWDTGYVEAFDGQTTLNNKLEQNPEKLYTEVEAIDGLIMATQYDVMWREDVFDGWDFYDVSQSLEMKKSGYKVVVPYQEKAWCYHDCGTSKLSEYDYYREKAIEEYQDCFNAKINKEEVYTAQKQRKEIENIQKGFVQLIEAGAYDQIEEIALEAGKICGLDEQTRAIIDITEIHKLEQESIENVQTEWLECGSWTKMYEYYTWVRWVMLRIANEKSDDRICELQQMLMQRRVSKDAIRKISTVIGKNSELIYDTLCSHEINEPLVSVVIQVYNGEDVIQKTIDSILNQSYKNIEILISDDASTDKSREIIELYEKKDDRVKALYFTRNHNLCYGGNACVQRANGKYIAIAGHDDVWKKDKLKKQIMFLEEHLTYGACFTWVDIINENDEVNNSEWLGLYHRFISSNRDENSWLRTLFFQGNFFCAPSACVRKSVVDKVGFYRYGLVQLQDYYLWMKVLLEAPVYILQEKLTLYRRFSANGKNLSEINPSTQRRDQHETQWICEDIIKRMPPTKFKKVFKDDMKNPNAVSEKEIICEKAFLLWKRGNCFAEKWFIELLEDEEYREILYKQYGFGLQDFYKLNTEPRYFD